MQEFQLKNSFIVGGSVVLQYTLDISLPKEHTPEILKLLRTIPDFGLPEPRCQLHKSDYALRLESLFGIMFTYSV